MAIFGPNISKYSQHLKLLLLSNQTIIRKSWYTTKTLQWAQKYKPHSTSEFRPLWVKQAHIIKIFLFRRMLKHNWVLSVISPTPKWMETTSCNPRFNMILETETNYPHWNMARTIALSPLNILSLQHICTLVCLRQKGLVSNARMPVKIKNNYRGLILSHTHQETLTWQEWYGKWII